MSDHDDTPDLNETNPHRALWLSETAVDQGERAWLRFVAKTEKLLGHDLDGDQDTQGFSLDFANDFFANGDTVEDYVAEVQGGDDYRRQCFQSINHTDNGRGVCADCGKAL